MLKINPVIDVREQMVRPLAFCQPGFVQTVVLELLVEVVEVVPMKPGTLLGSFDEERALTLSLP
jgi:hypothetical protein